MFTSHATCRLTAAIAAALGCLSASAATIIVTDGGDSGDPTTCTLRQALDSANADGALGGSSCVPGNGADTIQFAPSLANSTITLGGAALTITSDITLTGSGQILDANHASRVMTAFGPHTVALSTLSLRNGDAGNANGGGLYIKSVTATLQNLTISGNSAKSGGGILVNNSVFNLSQSSVSNNTATGTNGSALVVGGIHSSSNSSLTLDHVAITGNTTANNQTGAGSTGGLYDFGSSVSISDSTISGNSATTQCVNYCIVSGGIYAYANPAFSMTRSTVANNTASGPGASVKGVYVTGGMYINKPVQVDLHNITVAQNSASAAHHTVASDDAVGGLRVYAIATAVPLSNVTISANSATVTDVNAVALGGALLDGIVDLRNSIDSGNSGANAADLVLPSGGTLRSNLLGVALQGAQAGNGNRFADDPRLAALANNGGATATMALLPDSPAIDGGDNTLVPIGDTTDQRGAGFPRILGSAVDMGAFEFAASERETLIALYLATNGNGWSNNSNWCSGACPAAGVPTFNASGTECSWHGVTCDATHTHVTRIEMESNNLVGGPLPDLTVLTQLSILDLVDNAITGPLPDLHALTQLDTFRMDGNQLSGSIPSNLASWPALATFEVSDNDLTGTLPSLTGATQLVSFRAAGNRLTGAVPSLSGLSNLTYVELESNALTGPLPSLSGLAKLSLFYVNDNALSGTLPSLAGLTKLQDFDVNTNQLSGPLPSLAGFSLLEYAAFAGNQFSGGFPDLSGSPNLVYLDLSSNQLSGTLPDLSATPLQVFYVQSNQFSGAVPNPPPNLVANQAFLCPNPLTLSASPHDATWNAATGQTPWWGPAGGGCDGTAHGDFELLGNASFEQGTANWHTTGTCLFETASAGTVTAGYGRFTAPAATDGAHVLVADSQNFGNCSLYQDVTVPSGASSASLSAAVGYFARANWDARCSVDLAVVTPGGSVIAPYITLTGATSQALAPRAPITFGVTPGQVLRVQASVANECANYPAGLVLDDVQLTVQ